MPETTRNSRDGIGAFPIGKVWADAEFCRAVLSNPNRLHEEDFSERWPDDAAGTVQLAAVARPQAASGGLSDLALENVAFGITPTVLTDLTIASRSSPVAGTTFGTSAIKSSR